MSEKPKKSSSASTAKKAPKKPAARPVKTTRNVGGGTKSHPVTEERLHAAEDVIRKKPVAENKAYSKATESLKERAHAAAKKRAQQKILDKSYVSDPVDPLERMANTFDNSARRWEMVIYPSMFAFILLASYGFFLIYHLTHDISVLSKSVTEMAAIVSDAMPKMTRDMRGMTGSMDNMTADVSKMTDQMKALRPMNANLANMTDTMGSMNRSVYGMHRDVGNMNRTVSSGPMGMMNDIMPFSSNSYNNRPMPPPVYVPPAITPPPVRTYQPNIQKPKSSLNSPLRPVPSVLVNSSGVTQRR